MIDVKDKSIINCQYLKCKNKAKWHVVSGWGLDKKVCKIHKNKMHRNGSYSSCKEL
jgi:NRPS condensation-like uncharacterized protein